MPRDPITYERGRESPRAGWINYSRGRYFVTICAKGRECLFGDIVDGQVVLSQAGKIVEECWFDLPNHYGPLTLDAFVVMPNHIHGIIELRAGGGSGVALPEIIRAFKTESSRRVNNVRGMRGAPIWHRSFHDRLIRNGQQLEATRAYIAANPEWWVNDEHHPSRLKPARG